MYMDNLYKNFKLLRAAYAKNKLLNGLAKTHVRVIPEDIIQQEVKSKEK